MLTQIHIRHLATIEELQLSLHPHCSMITGETGAGKSIFIEAIELALGARGSANVVRQGKERADISLCFDLRNFPNAREWLTNHEFHQDSDECIIRRSINADGRTRSYINGLPATQQLVREIGDLLFHLHGQYEQQVLFQAENQRNMLDRFAEHLALANQVKQLAEQWKLLDTKITQLREKTLDRAERSDYLRFQVEELNAASLKEGEWQQLEAEHHKLSHSEDLLRHIEQAIQLISDDDDTTGLRTMRNIRKTMESVQQVEPKAEAWLNTIDNIVIQLGDLESECRTYLESTDLDPERMQYVEQRISQIFDICRKHKIKPENLAAYQLRLQGELDALASSDSDLDQLVNEKKKVESDYAIQAEKLSSSRQKAAATLSKTITQTIRSLALPHSQFDISLEADNNIISPHGREKIIFLIKTNPDQKLQALAKVISGGELSRLSLAAHLALAHVTSTPTLIFDEVDTGIGGATAEKVGKLLRELGESYQVFCVTHQPQVAACGHHHLFVEKSVIDKATHTRLRFLNPEEKTREIARMLSGEKMTQKTLDHAKELQELVLEPG